ncbi:MAG: peptidylprolyl isomerase [Verrucomicrobiota bacterium]|nr:peptidylprolyl isomerase [Verrucomicrobiota bacterium]
MKSIYAFFACFLIFGCTSTPPRVDTAPTSAYNPVVDKPIEFAPGADYAVVETKFGSFVIALDSKRAPQTVENFKKLIAQGFYDGTMFHRVIPRFVIQGGDPLSRDQNRRAEHGTGGPGYTVPAEITLKHVRGAVATARLGDEVNANRESNGSQFYVCLSDLPSLDQKYTVFGQVVRGLEVADAIGGQARDAKDNPKTPVEMKITLQTAEQALGVKNPDPKPQ